MVYVHFIRWILNCTICTILFVLHAQKTSLTNIKVDFFSSSQSLLLDLADICKTILQSMCI